MLLEIKLERSYVGWIAYPKDACLCPDCHAAKWGKNIQEAVDSLVEDEQENYLSTLGENDIEDFKYTWK